MKTIMSRLLVVSLTFILGVGVTLLWPEFHRAPVQSPQASPCSLSLSDEVAAPADLPILAYCELANNADKYNGKIVRVRARLGGFIHGMLFYDQNCPGAGAAIFYNQQNKEEIRRSLAQARGSDDWLIPVEVIAVGRFRKVVPSYDSDTIYDTASLQFEIIRIEKAYKPN
jgi:hypothetical protein